MKKRTIFIGAALAAALSFTALAAFAQTADIATVLETAAKDDVVEVEAEVAGASDDNVVTITDATGRVKLNFGPVWYSVYKFLAGEKLRVTAAVDKGQDGDKPAELDAITVTRPDGTVLEVRPLHGKPGWAGGPDVVGEKHPGYQASRSKNR